MKQLVELSSIGQLLPGKRWLGLAAASAVAVALGAGWAAAEPFSLSSAHMQRITAGGIVSDAVSEAAGYGKAPKTHSDADASVDPETGESRARGRGRGPKGSDGNASIAVADDEGEFATSADADGASKDRTKTSVDAHGRAKLSDTDYEGGSASSAKSGNSHTRSDTLFAQGGRGLSSEANAEGASDRGGETNSATDVEAHFTGENISHRTRARGSGSDMSSTSAKGSLLVERLGQTIEIVSEAESLSEQSSDAEVRNIVIKTASGTIVRSIARSGSTGRSVADLTAGIDIAMPDGSDALTAMRAARRAGEARASVVIVTPAGRE